MSDDIVTQLRERAVILFSNGADGNAFIDEQAADEIERLREALATSKHECQMADDAIQDLQTRLIEALRHD